MRLVPQERRIDITSQSSPVATPFRSTPGGASYAPRPKVLQHKTVRTEKK